MEGREPSPLCELHMLALFYPQKLSPKVSSKPSLRQPLPGPLEASGVFLGPGMEHLCRAVIC